jgi:lipoprotein-anchoring transpeptidase ErfK/SrfK
MQVKHGETLGRITSGIERPKEMPAPGSKITPMRIPISVILLITISACVTAPAQRPDTLAPRPEALNAPTAEPPHVSAALDVDAEVARLRAALMREVPGVTIDKSEHEQAWITQTQAAVAASGPTIDRPQFLVVVDRNPSVQQMRVVLARPDGAWESLGGIKISTGQMGRRDYYLTPTGVFLHTDAILDWRAEGTFNTQHIRGLGLKGMRVWDFGWQLATKGWRTGEEQGEIRLLLHSTDPDYLEQRLGRPASKGCVRIPAAMNRFLDRHSILDADYEQVAKDDPRFEALLLPGRTPTPLAGNALVVVDSSETSRPGA